MTVLVINRLCDTDRLSAFRKAARKQGVKALRIAAIDGHAPDAPFHAWAHLIGPHFWGAETIKPGALGCYLSHFRAWRHVVEHGLDWALICEDDADLAIGAEEIAAIGGALGDLDILFANDRLANGAEDLATALGQMTKQAPGADCYFVTRQGAERLIARAEANRITCGGDWAMVWGGLEPDAALPESAEIALLRAHSAAEIGGLKVRVAAAPVAFQRKNAPSRIQHGTEMALGALSGRDPLLIHADHAVLIPFGPVQLGFVGRSGKDAVMECHRGGKLWEDAALKALLQRFPQGGNFLDIGAHIGNHTVAMGRLAGANVLAVEPNAEVTGVLAMNLGLNGLTDRVELVAKAIGAEAGTGALDVRRRKPADSRVTFGEAPAETPEAADEEALPSFDGASPNRKVAVEVVTGDDLLGDSPVDAIKIDTSGGELDVLKVLRRVLKHQKPLLLIDFRANDHERITQFLARLGYRSLGEWPHDPPRRTVSLFGPSGRE
ncbi:FkbM family methyltransferase [Rhodobacteraceae bacterium NNCM2]|nr:FkbM family methyltransferase [Coraliihabitans acroporae]